MSWKHRLVWRGERNELQEGETTVGRSRSCDLSIADPSVSRRHVILIPDGERLLVRDLGSSNGTFLNGEKLEGEAHVDDGTALRLGDAELGISIELERPPVMTVPDAGSETRRLSPEEMGTLRAKIGVSPPAGGETTALSTEQIQSLQRGAEAQAAGRAAPVAPGSIPVETLPGVGAATTAITPEQMAAMQRDWNREAVVDGGPAAAGDGSPPEAPLSPSGPLPFERGDSEISFAGLGDEPAPPPSVPAAPAVPPPAVAAPAVEAPAVEAPAVEADAPAAPSFEGSPVDEPSFDASPVDDFASFDASPIDDPPSIEVPTFDPPAIAPPSIDPPAVDPPAIDPQAIDSPSSFDPPSVEVPVVEEPSAAAPPPPLVADSVAPPVRAVGETEEIGDSALLDLSSVSLPLESPPPVFGGDGAEATPPAPGGDSFDRPAVPVSDGTFNPPMTFDQPMPPAAPPPASSPPSVNPPPVSPPPVDEPAAGPGELLPSLDDIENALGSSASESGQDLATVPVAAPAPAGSASAAPAAGFFRRLVAYLLDAGLLTGIGYLGLVLVGDPLFVNAIVAGLSLVVTLGGWAIWGTTPGKRALHLYVHGPDGAAGIGLGRALLRLIGYLVSGALLLIGFLMILFRKDRRGLHDLIAGTTVQRHG